MSSNQTNAVNPTDHPTHGSPRRRRTAMVIGVALLGVLTDVGAAAAAPSRPSAVTVSIDLCATTGTAVLPNANTSGSTTTSVPIWSYVNGDCTGAAGTATLGGAPTITVTAGDTVDLTLHNGISGQVTALSFQGQGLTSDTSGATTGNTRHYVFVAGDPGTYLYESGLAPGFEHQVAMGMYGVLRVLPVAAGQAYDSASSAFDVEATVLISEVDPALNAAPTTFDLRNFKPKWTLVNGKPYPATNLLTTIGAGQQLLVRYVNAGVTYHSMSLLGADQRVIADDGNPLTHPYTVVAQTVGPGQTTDVIVDVSATAADGSFLTIQDGSLQTRNRNRRPASSSSYTRYGGPAALVKITGTPVVGDTVGPVTAGVTAVLATGAVHATVNDSATGNSNIAAAEYFVDVVGAAGTGVVMTATDAAFDSPLEGVDATIPPAVLAALLTGNHPVYVRGRDAAGNWGPVAAANLAVDVTGPSTSALSASPATTNGSAPVALNASGSDLGTGNANVVGAEYFIDVPVVNGSGTALTVSPVATTVSITGSIPAAAITPLAAGPHTIRVHALDSNGNWGTAAMATLTVDTVGPVTSTVVASPNPSNGAIGFNASVPAVRVTALTADASSNVVAAEGFIDTVGAVGTGFVLSPVDGIWNSPSESVRADIPLSTVVLLTNGTHTISVRGKDATGTWGAPTVINFVVDKVAPTVTGVATVAGPNTLTLSANVADTLTGLNRVEYFVDTDPGRGLATVMTAGAPPVYTAAIPTLLLSEGAHTVTVRAGDGAGNWTTAATINVTVNRTLAFSTAGNTNPPTVGGAADDADIYQYNGTFTRAVDVTTIANPVPAGANVDGLVRIDNTHFYLSFTDNTTTLPGLGAVQDEDIVFYNAGTWSVYFDGTSHGLGASNNQDIDAFDIVGTTIYFSTVGNTNPTGVTGTADDADIYSWNGTALARVWDASTHNVPGGGNVDGLSFVDSTHLFVSFGDNVTLSGGLGTFQDEDVAYYSAGAWSVWFDGTGKGLTANNQDLDAIDVP